MCVCVCVCEREREYVNVRVRVFVCMLVCVRVRARAHVRERERGRSLGQRGGGGEGGEERETERQRALPFNQPVSCFYIHYPLSHALRLLSCILTERIQQILVILMVRAFPFPTPKIKLYRRFCTANRKTRTSSRLPLSESVGATE